jgi:hypothetical protein
MSDSIKAARLKIIGGLGSWFSFLFDGSTDSTTYSNPGDITGTAGVPLQDLKSSGVLETSQITESAAWCYWW